MNHSILSICPKKSDRDERHALLIAADYEVVSVASTAEAFLLLEKQAFGVILLDSCFAKDAVNRSLLRDKGLVLALKFPVAPDVLMHAISTLVWRQKRTNRSANAATDGL